MLVVSLSSLRVKHLGPFRHCIRAWAMIGQFVPGTIDSGSVSSRSWVSACTVLGVDI